MQLHSKIPALNDKNIIFSFFIGFNIYLGMKERVSFVCRQALTKQPEKRQLAKLVENKKTVGASLLAISMGVDFSLAGKLLQKSQK